MLSLLNAHRLEHCKHFWLFQSQDPQPRSAGAAVLAGEKTQLPSTRSYPAKHVRQFPEDLSNELHWALTAVQTPLSLKKVLSAHSRQVFLLQVLQSRLLARALKN
jgi:hypothetical protein